MHKTLMLVLLWALFTACLQAQPANPSSDKNKAPGPTTIEGCLQSSDNIFTLIESDGTAHTLSGSEGKLSHQVGHQIELTGKDETRTIDTTPVGGASSAKVITVFQVKTIKQVADTCKSY